MSRASSFLYGMAEAFEGDHAISHAGLEALRREEIHRKYPVFSVRVSRLIEGKEPLEQLGIIREYVEQAELDKLVGHAPPDSEVDIVRRSYIRIASEVYRTQRSEA